MDNRRWFAVGCIHDECGYQAIQAPSAEEAIADFMASYDSGGEPMVLDDFHATMVAKWQGKETIRPADWANSGEGLTYSCSSCGEQTNCEEFEGVIVGDDVVCAFCPPTLTPEGRR